MNHSHRPPGESGYRWGLFVEGLRDSAPLALSIAAYGLVYGVVAAQSGMSLADVIFADIVVFSGSAQLVAVEMIRANASVFAVFSATLVMSLRHLLMGLSLAPRVRHVSRAPRCILAYLLNDESYALMISRTGGTQFPLGYAFGVGLATWLSWLAGTVAGACGSLGMPDPGRFGLDFAFVAVFLALLVLQLKDRTTLLAALGGGIAAALLAAMLPGNWYILAGTATSCLLGMAMEPRGFETPPVGGFQQ
ncbi:MAG: AzlC family ABC transporter permease [Firmicutes bacterium]|jgi:4-azaleucine resistance transporter AzlC|nr:AzlC family ABC transporter permease [Bacillota bacterium]